MSEAQENMELALDPAPVEDKEPEIVVREAEDDAPEGRSAGGEAPSVEDTLETLRNQLASERSRREHAERAAQEAATKVFRAESEVEDNNLHLINNAINTVTTNQNILKSNLKIAMANQDYDAAIEIQEEMGRNSARMEKLEDGKRSMEERPRREAPSFQADPVEEFASRLSPRSAAWVRAHPECVRDPRLQQKMIAAHNMVTADGVVVDSDDYFSNVENLMGMRGARSVAHEAAEDPTTTAAQVVSRRSAPAAAPVSRSVNGSGTGRTTVVSLSHAQREAAADMGMTPEEYARNLSALKREGKIH